MEEMGEGGVGCCRSGIWVEKEVMEVVDIEDDVEEEEG